MKTFLLISVICLNGKYLCDYSEYNDLKNSNQYNQLFHKSSKPLPRSLQTTKIRHEKLNGETKSRGVSFPIINRNAWGDVISSLNKFIPMLQLPQPGALTITHRRFINTIRFEVPSQRIECDCGRRVKQIRNQNQDNNDLYMAEYPWNVQVQRVDDMELICGGIIIAPQYILTTGSGVYIYKDSIASGNANILRIRYGAEHRRRRGIFVTGRDMAVTNISVPEKFDGLMTSTHNVALLKLERPIPELGRNPWVQAGCLPEPTYDASNKKGEESAWITAAPLIRIPTILKKTSFVVAKNSACSSILRNIYGFNTVAKRNDFLCPLDHTASLCGINGGLLHQEKNVSKSSVTILVGLKSFSGGCRDEKFIDVYTKLSLYTKWIRNQTDNSTCNRQIPLPLSN